MDTLELRDNETRIELAITNLKSARDRLRWSGANRAADYVARALKSAEGALRHARGKQFRTEGKDNV